MRILKKYFKEVLDNPSEHSIIFGLFFTILFGAFSWQYCEGYFSTIGINLSFNHLDNMLFTIERLASIDFYKVYFNYLWGILGCLLIILCSFFLQKTKPFFEGVLKTDASISVPFLFGFISIFYVGAYYASILSLILTIFFTLLTLSFVVRDSLENKFKLKSLTPIIAFTVVIGAFQISKTLGVKDAKKAILEDFKSLQSICLSKAGDSRGALKVCGKLIYEDSQRICLTEPEATYPICRKRDLYETTIIP